MFKRSGSLYGLILGFAAIFGAYLLEGGTFKALFMLPAMIIVFGGTFSATIIGVGFDKFKKIISLAKLAYYPPKYDIKQLIDGFVTVTIKSRQEGILAIESQLNKLVYPFPKKMMHFVMDGTDIDLLENIALGEMKAMQNRHNQHIGMFSKMGGYAPTMGIIGTVMGLIMTLANAGKDPTTLIHSIATAFIATLWGILSANLIWLPIADKLKQCHLEEKHMMEVSLEGVMAIQSGEIPSIVRSRLMSLLPQSEQGTIGSR
ncbi:MAG: MotA/TolQ/ExbB proton channel family protein [Ignavibacteriales bacterium]|nr:MotA/TolQ/ExbB proton channel family protein [Ignavibacteriota bacterium]MCB0746231.1 MotA/TolQ/ExbB proton channel family protein [Ignavibacteriota bacterium]MCB9248027.1 MotA/TolQ/ExbB proton channel family protein [Ignavibacteriales bacterium]